MRTILKNKKPAYSALLFTALLTISAWVHVQHYDQKYHIIEWDGYGYYLYLPAFFLYHDADNLAFTKEVQDKYHPTEGFYQAYKNKDTQKYVFKYPCGMAMLWSPFFGAAHMYAKFFGFEPDGFTTPYQLAILFANLLFAFLGIYFTYKNLALYFSDTIVIGSLALIVLGTNYFNQAAHCAVITHTASFLIFALILYLSLYYFVHQQVLNSYVCFALGCLIGLATIVRPTNIIVAIIPLFFGIQFLLTERTQKLSFIVISRAILLPFIGFIIFTFPQLWYWKMQSGQFFYFSYEPEEGFNFLQPYLNEVLFSYRKGWFVYTPLMLVVVAGFAFLFFHHKKLFFPFIIFFLFNTWIISSWRTWWYGGNFGQRSFVESYAFLIFNAACIIGYILHTKNIWIKYSLITIMVLLTVLNQFQTWQYMTGMYSANDMNKAYYWAIFGKTLATQKDRQLIDTDGVLNAILTIYDKNIAKRKIIYNDMLSYDSFHVQELTPASPFSKA